MRAVSLGALAAAAALVAACGAPHGARGDVPPAGRSAATPPLERRYVEGEAVRYVMTGVNQGRERTLRYTAEAEGRVVRDAQGRFVEEIRWTRLLSGDRDVPLDADSLAFVQRLSLEPGSEPAPPDIRGISPLLIGPVFDLMTFYVDLHPALHQGRLREAGDALRVEHGQPNSWADGVSVILGQDCIDFELALEHVDASSARLRVRHVPPREAGLELPAAWMREPILPGTPNNWVQVARDPGAAPGFTAAVGSERFDVLLEIERPSGRILAATMDNPVEVVQRRCQDQELSDCGEPARYRIHRRIELRRRD